MEVQRKSISISFATDLISEILLRLPEKSVVRFRCVSKLWLSITTDSYFINLFETQNPKPSLLICFQEEEDDDLIVSSIPQHTFSLDQNSTKSYSYSQPIQTYRMKFPEDPTFLTDSVHGLICLRTSTAVIVWNPSTRKLLTLPKPSKSNWSHIAIYLGYDPVEAKHKVIAMHSRETCTVCRVMTLGSAQESWRIVKTNQKHPTYYSNEFGLCINGVIYYIASIYWMYKHVLLLMRFDVRSEKLDTIELSFNIHVDRLIAYEGRLTCVYRKDLTKKNGCITLLILENAEENKWSSKDFLVPFKYIDQSLHFKLKGYTHAGEFIYEQYWYAYHKSLYALFFDPVRNGFRRAGFKGIAYDQEREGFIHIFPNHNESQMSL